MQAIAKLRSRSYIIDGKADRWWARVSAEQGYEGWIAPRNYGTAHVAFGS
jgi:hypothetical protein